MKKIVFIFLVLALCLSATACIGIAKPPEMPTVPPVDPMGEPVIVLDENNVERQPRYNANGKQVGYYQYTYGTNCGFYGVVLIEFLDMNDKVLNSYAPKLAGCTLASGQFGSMDHDYFELTDIWESDYNQVAVTSNEYKVVPYSGGKPYSYIENRKGVTTRCDLYGTNGKVVKSLTPAEPKNKLTIAHINIYTDDFYEDHFDIQEGYTEGDTGYATRRIFYSMKGALLGDFWFTTAPVPNSHMQNIVRIECKDEAGATQQVFEQSMEGSELRAFFDEQREVLYIGEYGERNTLMTAYCEPGTYELLFREQKIYENGTFSHTEMEVCGGEVVVTDGQRLDTYEKLEIYDAAGELQKTVTAPEAGGWMEARWEGEASWLWIDLYDASGNKVGYDVYEPFNQ